MATKFEKHLDTAQESLLSFLQTLVGQAVTLDVKLGQPVDQAAVFGEAEPYVKLVYASESEGFAVLLDQGWVGILAEGMLGMSMGIEDEGAVDLITEMGGQGYGSIRNALSGAGVVLPDVMFKVVKPGEAISPSDIPLDLIRIEANATVNGTALTAIVAVPFAQDEALPPPPDPVMPGERVEVSPAAFPDFGSPRRSHGGGDGEAGSFGMLAEVELEISVELGRRSIPLAEVLRLTTGSIVELEKLVGEPLAIYANGQLIAEGEAIVIDEQFGIRVTSLRTSARRALA
ncbi:MAG: flagellar motor switch protein FliN [Bacteroidota bacterium]